LDSVGYRLTNQPSNPDAPSLSNLSLSGKKLTITGRRLIEPLQVEINGLIVSPPLNTTTNGAGTKVKIKGSTSALNLRPGSNQVRVLSGALESNTLALNL
jgi:hypothetical protein